MKLQLLKDFADIIMGQSPPSASYNAERKGIPFFQGKAEFEGTYPRVEKWCDSPTKIAEKGDVLISVRAPVGPTNICPEKACIGRGLAAIRPKKNKSDNFFLLYYFRFIEKQLADRGKGSTFMSINREDIEMIRVPEIDYDKQKIIVQLLKKSESIFEKRRQTIQLADEFLKSVFLEMFGDPSKNPKKWPIKTLDEVSVLRGQYGSGAAAVEYDSDKPRYIRITDIEENGNLKDEKVSPSTKESEWKNCILSDGDILFARSGATVGKTYRFRERDGFCIFAGYLIRYRSDRKMLHPDYIYYFTKTDFYRKWILSKMKTVAQPNINARQYGSEFKMPVPVLTEQQKFADIVQKVEKYKEKLKQSETQLQNLFNSLMQRAFKGELV